MLLARGVIGFWPANCVDDDTLEVYADESRTQVVERLHHIRQQMTKNRDGVCHSLADFIAPRDSGKPDWIGGFAVTTGHGADELAREYEAAGDDYNAIMVKALADRLAEAFAERLHERVRKFESCSALGLPTASTAAEGSSSACVRAAHGSLPPPTARPATPGLRVAQCDR